MKLYRGHDGKLRLFRHERNVSRFRISASRMSLPSFEPLEVEKLIKTLASVDGPKWLPKDGPGRFLYIRPAMIGTQPQLGVRAPKEAMLFIVMSFMGRLDPVPGGMQLQTSPSGMVRAWAGGFGYAKIGPNYGPSVLAYNQALRNGFHQVLWLYGEQGECTEAGGSNFFIIWKRRDGQKELVTAPLDDQLILDGVTRRSCLNLVRERLHKGLVVSERKYTISELMDADAESRLVEAFSAGTAYLISAVSRIHHESRNIHIPMGPDGRSGETTALLKSWLEDIMYGTIQHEWASVVSDRE